MAIAWDNTMWGDLPASQVATGATGMGGYFDAPTVEDTFLGRPAALWQAARLGQMSHAQAALPQFQRTAMAGYQPEYGRYLLGGGMGSFGDYLGSGNLPTGTTRDQQVGENWQAALAASAVLRDPTANLQERLNPQALGLQAFLAPTAEVSAAEVRANALAMAQAAMGGGVGYGAQTKQRAIANMYDLYAARAAGAGANPGGFLSWFGDRYSQA